MVITPNLVVGERSSGSPGNCFVVGGTDFSDDLTNLSYTHRGAFINMVAKF